MVSKHTISDNSFSFMQSIWPSPIGSLLIVTDHDQLTSIQFTENPALVTAKPSTLIDTVIQQLSNYFAQPGSTFAIPLAPAPTVFQQRLRDYLLAIPHGETRTYGECASALKSSARAVGNACRANPIPIIVPCHRIVARHGVGGYAGATAGKQIARKCWLLEHEQE